jgi:hypothetical protein
VDNETFGNAVHDLGLAAQRMADASGYHATFAIQFEHESKSVIFRCHPKGCPERPKMPFDVDPADIPDAFKQLFE